MRMELFAIFDSASAAYLPPFVAATTAMVVRQIRDHASRDATHDFVRHGDQFVLFRLGEWDNETALLTPCAPTSLGTMQSILAKPNGGSDVSR